MGKRREEMKKSRRGNRTEKRVGNGAWTEEIKVEEGQGKVGAGGMLRRMMSQGFQGLSTLSGCNMIDGV